MTTEWTDAMLHGAVDSMRRGMVYGMRHGMEHGRARLWAV